MLLRAGVALASGRHRSPTGVALEPSAEWQVYRLGARRRAVYIAVATFGGVVLAHSLIARPQLWWLEAFVGFLFVAAGIGAVTESVCKLSPEGVTIRRGGYLATDKLVRWPSIRSVEVVSDHEVHLHLLDRSVTELRIGALSEADRMRLISEIQRRTRRA